MGSAHEVIEVRVRQLKAVFFVKTFEGDPERVDVGGFIDGPQETPQGRKIAVRFRDGEFTCGYTMSWSPDRDGFFLFPADPGSNNDRIYVLLSGTDEIKAGPQAEALAQRVLAATSARGGKPDGPGAARPGVPAESPRGGVVPGGAATKRPTVIGPRPRNNPA